VTLKNFTVAEQFYSIQGEGMFAGVPSYFIRLFGCNLRCKNFGRDPNEKIQGPNPDVQKIIQLIPQIKQEDKQYRDLPLAKSGCDTYAAIYPEFRFLSKEMSTQEILHKIEHDLPAGVKFGENVHLILTGGEPLIWQKDLMRLIDDVAYSNLIECDLNVTFETNGTQDLKDSFINEIEDRNHEFLSCTFSISPKLSPSGELREKTILPHVIEKYDDLCTNVFNNIYFKFVVDSEKSADEVTHLMENEFRPFSHVPVYLMAEGGTFENHQANEAKVARLAMERGWRYSPRLHCSIFRNDWGT